MYDWFVAKLRCPACDSIAPATSATNMQTHVRDDADGSELGVGAVLDPLDVRTDDILSSGYQLVAQPDPGQPIRLLDVWECPACRRSDNWAMISIRVVPAPPSIDAIDAVTLDRATLERAHFVSDSCALVAARLSGVALDDLTTGAMSCVDVLLEASREPEG